jgi:hypothetical protein
MRFGEDCSPPANWRPMYSARLICSCHYVKITNRRHRSKSLPCMGLLLSSIKGDVPACRCVCLMQKNGKQRQSTNRTRLLIFT